MKIIKCKKLCDGIFFLRIVFLHSLFSQCSNIQSEIKNSPNKEDKFMDINAVLKIAGKVVSVASALVSLGLTIVNSSNKTTKKN